MENRKEVIRKFEKEVWPTFQKVYSKVTPSHDLFEALLYAYTLGFLAGESEAIDKYTKEIQRRVLNKP